RERKEREEKEKKRRQDEQLKREIVRCTECNGKGKIKTQNSRYIATYGYNCPSCAGTGKRSKYDEINRVSNLKEKRHWW
ncbi:MAG: hypothetical protein K9I69_07890, partial [Ignavibacteriales bacterium]|nr:hypothetical protein [Ignavibacteriales bacterium]